MSDAFLDNLAGDLKPVKPLRNASLWLGAAVGFVIAVAYILKFYGMRPELHGLMHGVWPADPMPMLKPVLFLVTGGLAFWAVADLARPEGRLKKRFVAPVALWLAVTVVGLVSDFAGGGWQRLADGLNGGMMICYITILCGGMAGLIALWRLWLRRSASSHPVALGAMAGMGTASLMAAAYALHCTMDAPVYILFVYSAAVAIISGLAALLGGRLLRW
ncbi:MAG: DUF1109 domain-containing protein [Asticcacaulis sp.]|nr:DUF1109 domain-containing protein [Asticcacaulis sp.]